MSSVASRIAVVILNYNGADLTLSNATRLRELSEDLKIIVVDNCSTDDSREKLRALRGVKNTYYLENDVNSGYAAGNNVGLRFASSELGEVDAVCVMNPDILVERAEDFELLYNALMSEEKLAGITALTIFNGTIRQPNDFGWKELTAKHMMFSGTLLGKLFKSNLRYCNLKLNENKVAYADILQGCFFMVKKSILEQADFLDEETFLYQEEAILGKKLARLGYKQGVLTSVFVYHNHMEKDKKLVKKQNKLFDMNCFYSSRKYYIRNYSEKSGLFIAVATGFLNLDFALKKFLMLFVS